MAVLCIYSVVDPGGLTGLDEAPFSFNFNLPIQIEINLPNPDFYY